MFGVSMQKNYIDDISLSNQAIVLVIQAVDQSFSDWM